MSEIYLNYLCYWDRRNPNYNITIETGYDQEDIDSTGNFARENCYCDNCFYGRAKLTEQLIKLKENSYNEDEVLDICSLLIVEQHNGSKRNTMFFDLLDWFKQFKKKQK